ncbi:HNH endonuclease [Brachybacterium endophyticum]|uniref:HNH endonuclease n=1 Tax=Brachybacterium endophyticum TaxID=2182385 RepID=A0A2U2RHF5_9MICO|nr:HNH endonuclease [Brachybacterium endophyticum]
MKRSGWNNQHARMRQLPKDWRRIRQSVIARDSGRCVQCGERGTDVDHIARGNDHSIENLRLLCRSCHMRRTGRDGGTAKRRPKRTHRPPRQHPGFRSDRDAA